MSVCVSVCACVRFAVDTELVKRKKEKKKSMNDWRYFWKREREGKETGREREKKLNQTERIIKKHVKKRRKGEK